MLIAGMPLGLSMIWGTLWKQRGILTSSGTPIKNGQQVNDLTAVLFPSVTAVIKTETHTKRAEFEYEKCPS